jgi:hypothetical protein
MHASIILRDAAHGVSTISLVGPVSGQSATMRVVRFVPLGPTNPTRLTVNLAFAPDYSAATGTWVSDAGTSGDLIIEPDDTGWLGWMVRSSRAALRIAAGKIGPWAYGALLVGIGLIDLSEHVEVSYAALILLVLPVPYLFWNFVDQVLSLVRGLRLKRLGPLEFDQPDLGDRTQGLMVSLQRQALELGVFLVLDRVLVPLTQIVVVWVASKGSVDRPDFETFARSVGIADASLDATWNALIASGCAQLDVESGRLRLTDLGHRYVGHLQQIYGMQSVRPS